MFNKNNEIRVYMDTLGYYTYLTKTGVKSVNKIFDIADQNHDNYLNKDELKYLSTITNDPTDPKDSDFDQLLIIFDHTELGVSKRGLRDIYIIAGEVILSYDLKILNIPSQKPMFNFTYKVLPWLIIFPVLFFVNIQYR
eukprot:UN01139